MKMEDSGPEVAKRARLGGHYGESPPVQNLYDPPPEPGVPLPSHSYPGHQALRPPSAYSRPPPPPSPYGANPDSRAHHDHPPPSSYDHHRPRYTPPGRDRPPPPDTNPHHGVPSTMTQSPDRGPGVALRPLNTTLEHPPPLYGHPPPRQEGVEPTHGYAVHEPPNGIYHGLPGPQGPHQGHPVDTSQAPPPGPSHGPPLSQGPPPVQAYPEVQVQHPGPPYSAGPFTGPQTAVPWVSRPQYQPPKKGTRAQQACEVCRQRKARCDEGRPTCGYCKENGTNCVYKEMQAPKADRAQKEIMDHLKKNGEDYEHLQTSFKTLDAKVDRVEEALRDIARYLGGDRKDGANLESKMLERKRESPTVSHETPRRLAPESSLSSPEQTRSDLNYQLAHAFDPENVEETSTGVSIHVDHTTGVHRLLKWPSIADLLFKYPIGENYVMEKEGRKGLLRVYGKGQGIDRYDGGQSRSPSSPSSVASGEDASRSPSTSSDDNLWGFDLGQPNIVEGRFFNNEKDHPGGLNPDGSLKLDRYTMIRLQNSYLDNIHILHPFLDKTRLTRLIEKVCREYNPNEPYHVHQPVSTSPFAPHSKSLKRKHSSGDSPGEIGASTSQNRPHEEPKLTRRISTAVVLLVMAIGKICLHTDPLPDFRFANDAVKEGSSLSHSTSPNNHTFSPTTTVSSPMSAGDMRGVSASNRTSILNPSSQKAPRKGDKNVDVIPGLAYFARAVEILGALQGHDLQFVQANLLAGIYKGQLACVMESWTWIQHACRACQFLVRDPALINQDPKNKNKAELIRFAYLTCLQLESDILAEMDLPSGIQNIDSKNVVNLPEGVVDDAADLPSSHGKFSPVMIYYSYQLLLRKLMNSWQKLLYPPNGNEYLEQRFNNTSAVDISMADRNGCQETLTALRNMMDPSMRWNDTDPPSSDVNAARLRGKFYGAKYIIHRPFLYYALHYFNEDHLTEKVMERYKDFNRDPLQFKLEDRPPPNASRADQQDWLVFQMLVSCRLCVDAAKCSTEAFDGVMRHKRLIVTNIMGTAHAQFGNMLVLAATFTKKHLSWLIPKDELFRLLNRTINFLQDLAPISTTLEKDANILRWIRDKIEGSLSGNSDLPHLGSSFSSSSNR